MRQAAEQARLELEKEAGTCSFLFITFLYSNLASFVLNLQLAQLASAEEEATLLELELQKNKDKQAVQVQSDMILQSSSSPDLTQDAFLKRELSRKRLNISREAKESMMVVAECILSFLIV
jgi:hypothetical protein